MSNARQIGFYEDTDNALAFHIFLRNISARKVRRVRYFVLNNSSRELTTFFTVSTAAGRIL